MVIRLWKRLFGFGGRLGRFRYFKHMLAYFIILNIMAGSWMRILFVHEFIVMNIRHFMPLAGVSAAVGAVVYISILSLKIRRLHDMNHSGRWVLLELLGLILICFSGYSAITFLAGAGLFCFNAYLLFFGGHCGHNKYGPDENVLYKNFGHTISTGFLEFLNQRIQR